MENLASYYGVDETNPLLDGHQYHAATDYSHDYTLREISDNGGKITRVRILREYNRCDISYIRATLADGTIVPVDLNGMYDFHTGLYFKLKGEFIEWAKKEGVFAKALGLLDRENWSVLAS
jgi:hypothetical protein